MIVDASKAATLMLPNTTSAQSSEHNALSLGTTVADIFDISPGQALSIDTSASRGDIIIADSTPNWAILANPGASYHLQTDANDVTWAQDITMAASAWVGLGAAAGRFTFDSDAAPDQIKMISANLVVGTSAFIGLGPGGGRIEFDSDPATHEFNVRTANVGINTATPARRLHVVDTSGSIARLEYDSSNYADLNVSSGGNLSVEATGNLHVMAGSVGVNTLTPDRRLHVLDSSGSTMRLEYDATNYVDMDIGSGGNLTVAPTGDFIFDPTGNDILPETGYDLNIGLINQKYLTLHVAELWVETLVAQETIATIGGRILVGPTTQLTRNLDNAASTIYVKHNQMASGDIAYMEAQGKVEFLSIDTGYSAEGTDVVSNWTFESPAGGGSGTDFDDWTEVPSDGAILQTWVGAEVYANTYACELTAGASLDTLVRQDVTVVPETRYMLSFWSRGDGTNAGRYRVYDQTNSQAIIPLTSTGITGTTYVQTFVYFVSPADCVSVRLTLRCPGADTGVCFFDNVRILDSEYSYGVTRDLDGTGANLWWAGDAMFNTGTTGNGFIDLYSLYGVSASGNTAGPTIVGNVRASSTYNDWSEHWAIGNLNGLYGYGAASYGVGLGRYADGYSHMTIDEGNGVRFFTDTDAVEAQFSASVLTLGRTTEEHLRLETSSLQFKDGATVEAQLSSSTWTLGRTTNEHLQIESSAMKFQDGGTAVGFWTGSAFQVGRSASANVNISNTNGIRIREGSVVKGLWQADGDIFIGSDISAAASTYFSVFATAQTYNSESVGSGDMMIGDNSASMANIFWDQSQSKLLFRGGTASAAGIDSDGKIEAGGGTITLDEEGHHILITTAYDDTRGVQFVSGGSVHSMFQGYTETTLNHARIIAASFASKDTIVNLESNAPNGQQAAVLLSAQVVTQDNAALTITSQSAGGKATFNNADVYVDESGASANGDVRIKGGLYVGSIGVDPDTDDIWCDGEVSSDGGTTRWDMGGYTNTTDTATGHIKITINGTEYRVLTYAAP